MSNILRFPAGRISSVQANPAALAAMRIPREEFERLAELALDVVDRIIRLLDESDGDSDLEPDADAEPSLAAPTGGASQVLWAAGTDSDEEM
ncbi:hypothetical protein VQ03_27320 [Methylobacterium tarhaniae]|uniref:Uncharacterized protein n=1 Tax=Methylobacterium tarhaniae TaxID=1187852 RepID=A0A0J6UY48_9HYPH|nr:hypothetical protein [Methylobacterium tarhaniae]KMO31306.1 hypothetical protein VQ03_27320 [Methylobacterium tarhaniae]